MFFEEKHIRFREDIYKACLPLWTSEFKNLWNSEDSETIKTCKIHTNTDVDLDLDYSHIGDVGMQAFSSALASGALASLEMLRLRGNQIGDAGMQAFSSAIAGGALADLTHLDLSYNQIGDVGMQAFSSAIAEHGALADLTDLELAYNHIGDAGIEALSDALATGALASIMEINLNYNFGLPEMRQQMRDVAATRGIHVNIRRCRSASLILMQPRSY